MIPEVTSILNLGAKASPKDVAAKVQGMFMEVMLKAMEDSVGAEEGLFGKSASSDIYRGMLREQLAGAMTAQMQSPLETQLYQALSKPADSPAGEEGAPRIPLTMPVGARHSAPQSDDHGHDEHEESGLPVAGRISSPQGWRHDPMNGAMKYHAGTDIAAPLGTPIRAVASGRVIESGRKGSYGNAVVIETEDGRKMLYAHNNQNFVQVGDRVSQGESIAEVGTTGRSTGPHVHFEVKF